LSVTEFSWGTDPSMSTSAKVNSWSVTPRNILLSNIIDSCLGNTDQGEER